MAKRINISVKTVPNGYVLKVGDAEDFLYFNEIDLLAGFMARVGALSTKPMEKSDILSTVVDLLLGSEYSKNVDNLKKKIELVYNHALKVEKRLAEIELKMPINPKPKKEPKKKIVPDGPMSEIAKTKLEELEEKMKENPNIK